MIPLEPTRDDVEDWLASVARHVLDHVDRLATMPSAGATGALIGYSVSLPYLKLRKQLGLNR